MSIMVKSARAFASLIILVSLSVLFSTRSEAFDLTKPILDETIGNPVQRFLAPPDSIGASQERVYGAGQQITDNNQPETYNLKPGTYTPSVTFGQLLDGSYEQMKAANQYQKEITESVRIKEMLAKLEESYKESINSNQLLSDKAIKQTTDNMEQITDNNQPTTYNLQLTTISPTSTVSNLIANISDIINNNKITDNMEQITNNNQSITYNAQPTTFIGDPKKSWFTIALLGDSMTDTLGSDLPALKQLLKEAYPDYTFNLLNYGQGATDIESGLYRLTSTTTYLGKEYPPLLSSRPDILVIESFAYNPWTWEKYDLDREWLTIAKIIDNVKANSPDTKIILAATVAPNTKIFGDGSLNWSADLKWKKATTIKLYLQNLVNFATSQNYPLADAYHPSLDASGEGQEKYINGGDNLHPSEEGKQLYAQKIVETIKQNNLIQ